MDCHGSGSHSSFLSVNPSVQNRNVCLEPLSSVHYGEAPYIVQAPHSIEIHHHTYDPNLSSAARYSPPNYNTISTIDLDTQLQEIVQSSIANSVGEEFHHHHNVDNGSSITYSNVIFVPHNGNNVPETENNSSLIDPNQAYILSSDPRFFGSYIRGSEEDEASLVNGTHEPSGIPLDYHGYHIQSETGKYIEQIPADDDGCDQQQHEMIDSSDNGDTTQIIIQGTNGQFYRQIQNVHYVNSDGQKMGNSVELVMNGNNNDGMGNVYDQGIFHTTSYDDQSTVHHHHHHPLDGLSMLPTVADAELLINSAAYEGYKPDYAGLDNDGLLAAHHLIDLGGDFSGQSTTGGSSITRTPLAEELAFLERQHERSLLESTMSPLLAAVNDITSRDEHLQQYLDHTSHKESQNVHLPSQSEFHPHYQSTDYVLSNLDTNCSIHSDPPLSYPAEPPMQPQQQPQPQQPQPQQPHHLTYHRSMDQNATADEYVDINDMEFQSSREETTGRENLLVRRSQRKTTKKDEELLIADKHVPCRAWASLPSGYLFIGQSPDDANEYSVFAKKEISLRTKFGPIEGDTKCLLPSELELIKNDTQRMLPVLFVNDIRMIDVSNEYTSNWMRFVRLAHTFSEQNMLLEETDDSRLFYRCCQPIAPKEEVKVGYSRPYAERYGLSFLEPTFAELQAITDRWPCFECNAKFESSELLQTHLETHGKRKHISTKEQKATLNGRRRKRISRLSTRKVSGPTVRYACCFCSQVFTKLVAFKKHNQANHPQQEEETRIGMSTTATASILQNSNIQNRARANRCEQCRRYFPSAERFEKHRRMHCPTNATKMIHCKYCPKKLMTDSAMAMHVKSHLNKIRCFQCVLCSQRFNLPIDMMEHVPQHLEDGFYKCPKCGRKYTKYADIRKHVRAIHPDVSYPCPVCGSCFKSPNKLRLHQLRHSDVRAFECLECGSQFKRKDKLQRHIVSQHSKRKEATIEQSTVITSDSLPKPSKKIVRKVAKKSIANKAAKTIQINSTETNVSVCGTVPVNHLIKEIKIDSVPNFKTSTNAVINDIPLPPSEFPHNNPPNQESYPLNHIPAQTYLDQIDDNSPYFHDVPNPSSHSEPIDYQRFIYKCHTCRLGFKRRGMLVNHLVKLHPTIPVDSVPELNLPILKAQRFYYCAYCDKVYKSNSKRKWHILKNHPGRELPVSCKVIGATEQIEPGMPNPSFSEPVGNVTALPQHCNWCHKQYASKGRLLNHHRQAHPDRIADESNYKQTQSMPLVSSTGPNEYVYKQTYNVEAPFEHYATHNDSNALLPDNQFTEYLPNDQHMLYQL